VLFIIAIYVALLYQKGVFSTLISEQMRMENEAAIGKCDFKDVSSQR